MILHRFATIAVLSIPALGAAAASPITLPQTDTIEQWSAVAADAGSIWLGSESGKVAYSADHGENWQVTGPTGSQPLPIGQIKAIGEREAYLLTSGRGTNSRLYHTRNGGFSWNRVHRSNGQETLRCFDLSPSGEAWILGGSLQNEWNVVRSSNSRTWLSSRSGFDKSALPDESGYTESGSCVRFANNTWAMGSAYASQARLMLKTASALRFSVVETPIEGDQPAITAVWPLGRDDVLFTGGNLGEVEAESVLHRYRNGSFSSYDGLPLRGLLTNVSVYQGFKVVANEQGIAWQPLDSSAGDWALLEQPVRQLICTFEEGCYAIGSEGLIHFAPNAD